MSTRVSDATGRIQLRRLDTRRHRLIRTLGMLAVGSLVLGLTWLIAASPVLAAKAVRVEGIKVLTTEQVTEVAGVPTGLPLVWVDVASVADRVAGLAPVDTVAVARSWPNAVTIHITERHPQFVVEAGGGYLIVDAAGVAYQAVSEVPKGLLVAQARPDNPRLLRDLGTVMAALDSALRSKLKRVRATTPDSITLDLDNGVEIVWGSAEQSALKQQVLTALMAARKANRYDVSAPANPITR